MIRPSGRMRPAPGPVSPMNITRTSPTLLRRLLLRLSLGALLAAFASPAVSSAATIEPTTWYSAGTAGTPVADDGLQFVTNGDTTSGGGGLQHILTYFSPTSIANVGDSIGVSLTFSGVRIGTPTTYHFGFAFYNSGGNQISANALGQQDPAFSAYRGYRVGTRPVTNAGNEPFELRGRTGNNNALANTGTAHATLIGTGGEVLGTNRGIESNTLYNVSYVLTRTGENTLSVALSIVGGTLVGYSETWTITGTEANPLFTEFDTFAISLGSVNNFSTLTLYDVSITSIPEPSTAAALLGLGALGLASLRRRRR